MKKIKKNTIGEDAPIEITYNTPPLREGTISILVTRLDGSTENYSINNERLEGIFTESFIENFLTHRLASICYMPTRS